MIKLKGNGDFASKEVTSLRDESDIIVTNPPFSLFRKFVKWIFDADKKFLIIGNQNAITYKEVFPLIAQNKMWLGGGTGLSWYFKVPDNFIYREDYPHDKDRNGEKVFRVQGPCWFTNLDHGKRHEPMQLMTMEDNLKFNTIAKNKPNAYKKYDNYDAIEIPDIRCLPSDYEGVMGVPITWIHRYCPDQFEIVGFRKNEDGTNEIVSLSDSSISRERAESTTFQAASNATSREARSTRESLFDDVLRPIINGKGIYRRITIRHRNTAN